jgi:hypothetical protein
MSLVARLAGLDRRLPPLSAALVGATTAAVLAGGTVAAFTKNAATASPAALAEATRSPSAAPSASPTATRPARADDPSDFLPDVKTVLPDYDRLGDRVAGAGPMDLEDAAFIEAGGKSPREQDRKVLRDLGFVRGHSRAWSDGDTTVVVFVYEWKDTDGPLTFVRGMQEVHKTTNQGWKPPMRRAYGVCQKQGAQTADSVLAAVGKHSFLVIAIRDGACTAHEPVTQVADLVVKHATRLGA